ncbi:MAG: helix-turn-helix domain-containing protein [Chloroflexota bacterium]|nr:helix-turn-helix domain-containing protein [Chloroflexota bacterium]
MSIPQDERRNTCAREVFPGRLGIAPEEFFAAVRMSRTAGYLALQRGEIPHCRIGRRIIIPLDALDAWFAGKGWEVRS